jgi:hypothetical protein
VEPALGRPDEEPPGVRRIRAILKWSGEHDFPSGCPLWTALSLEASRHDGVAAVLLDAPPSQQRASMLLAAVHDLVLAGVEHPLRSYFPTMSRDPRPVDDRLASVFVDFVERHESELRHLVGSRTVQTNEVGRAVGVRLAVAAVCADAPTPVVDVVEIGAAAGLLLGFDRYDCRIGDDRFPSPVDDADALVLEPLLLGGAVPAAWVVAAPVVQHRIGLDISPLDVRSVEDRRWLHACVWPSQTHRHDQLDRAIRVTQHVNPTMATANATLVSEHITALPGGAATVVVSSWTLAYLSEHDRTGVLDQICALSIGRTISLVCLEGDGIVPGITSSIEPIGSHPLVISITHFSDGDRSDRILGALGAQGDWITLIET